MKLVYYGLFDRPSDCENWICSALSRAGVLVYRWQKQIGSVHSDWNQFIDYVKREKIEVVLISKAPELSPEQLKKLKNETGCKIVWWTFDWMNNPRVKSWYFPLAKVSDICFQTDGFGEDRIYKTEGINRVELHQAAEPIIHDKFTGVLTNEETKKYSADIAFFGSLYTEKRKKMDELLRRTYGHKYKVWGGKAGFEDGLWNEEFRKAVSATKIVIGDNYTCDVAGYWSDRVYLTLGCGGFFLTSYVQGMDEKFGIKNYLTTWTTMNVLLERINYYLVHPEERLKMSEDGYKFVRENHTYDNRIKTFIQKIGEL